MRAYAYVWYTYTPSLLPLEKRYTFRHPSSRDSTFSAFAVLALLFWHNRHQSCIVVGLKWHTTTRRCVHNESLSSSDVNAPVTISVYILQLHSVEGETQR